MYRYTVYNYVLCSNYKCDYLSEATDAFEYEDKMIKVDIKLSSGLSKTSCFNYQYVNNKFFGKWKDTSFWVDFEGFSISIVAPTIETAFLVLLNVPLSLLLLNERKVIFHSSCAIDTTGVYAFSANKGDGKSTICSLFATDERRIFSDDTICIDIDKNRIYSNNSIEKYSIDTVRMLEPFIKFGNLKVNDYNNKLIKRLDHLQRGQHLEKLKIIFLFRGASFHSIDSLDDFVFKQLLLNNIVGYKYADFKKRIIAHEIANALSKCVRKSSRILLVPEIDMNSILTFRDELVENLI